MNQSSSCKIKRRSGRVSVIIEPRKEGGQVGWRLSVLSAGVEIIEKKLVRVETIELAGVDNAKEHRPQFAGPDSVMPIVIFTSHNGHSK